MLDKVTLFIDCEWNGFHGDFISMALVPELGTVPFYEVVEPGPLVDLDPWVAANVIPVLNKEPLPDMFSFRRKLEEYINQWSEVTIVADWPEDIKYFCDALITAPGRRIEIPALTFKIMSIDSVSDIPHNALADATANRDYARFKGFI